MNYLWKPSNKIVENSNLNKFSKFIGIEFKEDFKKLWEWSVNNPEVFWSKIWDFTKIIGDKGTEILRENKTFYKSKFFPNARINYSENLLKKRTNDIAINFLSEKGFEENITWSQLYEKVCRLSSFLKSLGLKKGDRVAGYVPNKIESIISFLACAKNGLVWSSCSPDFGIDGVVDRFKQIEPKVLISCDYYYYNGKKINILEKLKEIIKRIQSINKTIVFNYNKSEYETINNFIKFEDALNSEFDETFERFEFNHPIYILYSSGTTGKPKCITHGAGNVLIEHNKEFILHCDVTDNEKLFYYTTTGWMMWNWLVGGLASGASIFLFDGAPVFPKIDVLLEYCQNKKINLFGVSAKYIDHLKNEKYNSRKLDLSSIRIITSTGSPLAEESFKYVYENIKQDVHLASIAGGTDLVGCLVLGNLFSKVFKGEIQGESLGIDVDIFNEKNNSAKNGEKGELVVKKPFPSMPVKFWNDPENKKYHKAYFSKYENIWHHGDFIERTSNNGFIMRGRSDATLNPGGVRIGTSEIYQQVEDLDYITEALVVGQDFKDDVRIILFVTTKNDQDLGEEKIKSIKSKIRKNCSPKHVPSLIIKAPQIPRTKSGKIVELAVRNMINGEKIMNLEAISNPESLNFFQNLPQLKV
tara:strand:+ start:1284 stop:3209 length:1926 start_codon:yes stop_codon:yes gene_type:complete